MRKSLISHYFFYELLNLRRILHWTPAMNSFMGFQTQHNLRKVLHQLKSVWPSRTSNCKWACAYKPVSVYTAPTLKKSYVSLHKLSILIQFRRPISIRLVIVLHQKNLKSLSLKNSIQISTDTIRIPGIRLRHQIWSSERVALFFFRKKK